MRPKARPEHGNLFSLAQYFKRCKDEDIKITAQRAEEEYIELIDYIIKLESKLYRIEKILE